MEDGSPPTSKGHSKAGLVRGAGKLLIWLCISITFSCEISTEPEVDDTPQAPSYRIRAEHSAVEIKDAPFLHEVSGMAQSLHADSILWVHNDSGDDPVLYAISKTGNFLGSIELTGVEHHDWEDITSIHDPRSGKNYLYVGDFGDNKAQYTSYKIIRVEEPQPMEYRNKRVSINADYKEYFYSDIETQDAEAFIVVPSTLEIFILSKVINNARIYSLGEPFSSIINGPHTATRLGTFETGLVTSADLNDGQLLIKTYTNILCFSLDTELMNTLNSTPTYLPYSPEPRGESVCWDVDNTGYFTMSELAGGTTPILNYYKIMN